MGVGGAADVADYVRASMSYEPPFNGLEASLIFNFTFRQELNAGDILELTLDGFGGRSVPQGAFRPLRGVSAAHFFSSLCSWKQGTKVRP